MRQLIKDALPDVVEEWKWMGTSIWSSDGIICTGESFKALVRQAAALNRARRVTPGKSSATRVARPGAATSDIRGAWTPTLPASGAFERRPSARDGAYRKHRRNRARKAVLTHHIAAGNFAAVAIG